MNINVSSDFEKITEFLNSNNVSDEFLRIEIDEEVLKKEYENSVVIEASIEDEVVGCIFGIKYEVEVPDGKEVWALITHLCVKEDHRKSGLVNKLRLKLQEVLNEQGIVYGYSVTNWKLNDWSLGLPMFKIDTSVLDNFNIENVKVLPDESPTANVTGIVKRVRELSTDMREIHTLNSTSNVQGNVKYFTFTLPEKTIVCHMTKIDGSNKDQELRKFIMYIKDKVHFIQGFLVAKIDTTSIMLEDYVQLDYSNKRYLNYHGPLSQLSIKTDDVHLELK